MKDKRIARRELPEVRAQFARMIDRGVAPDAIKAALGLGRSTFFKWRSAYRSGGVDALMVRPISGGVSKLTDEQTRQLRGWLTGKDPRQFQFDFALWTRAIVGQLIQDRLGIDMTPQGVGKLLRRLGFSPQRPLYRAYQQDPAAVTAWRETEFPKIRERARQEGADVYFADEAGIRSDHHAGTTWAPVGQTPVVMTTGERASVNMISAISPRGELKFDVFHGNFNATVFIEFLKKLVHDSINPIFLIVDNVPAHKATIVKKYVTSLEGRLQLFFLPPYSPELNPDEWVWKNIKHDQVKRQAVHRKGDFFELVLKALENLRSRPDTVRAFFRDPSLLYIAM